jgi:hypothetical protein
MRRDSRDAGKRNSSFTAITSSPESFGGSQSKLKIILEIVKSFVRLGIIDGFVKSSPMLQGQSAQLRMDTNQRLPAERGPAPSRGLPNTPALPVVADF